MVGIRKLCLARRHLHHVTGSETEAPGAIVVESGVTSLHEYSGPENVDETVVSTLGRRRERLHA